MINSTTIKAGDTVFLIINNVPASAIIHRKTTIEEYDMNQKKRMTRTRYALKGYNKEFTEGELFESPESLTASITKQVKDAAVKPTVPTVGKDSKPTDESVGKDKK